MGSRTDNSSRRHGGGLASYPFHFSLSSHASRAQLTLHGQEFACPERSVRRSVNAPSSRPATGAPGMAGFHQPDAATTRGNATFRSGPCFFVERNPDRSRNAAPASNRGPRRRSIHG